MRVKVLGSAAGGGFPQWNCACSNCARLRAGQLKGRARTQAQAAVSADKASWFLLNASPDLRQQLSLDSEFAPRQGTRSTPIRGVILTSADVDCVTGLLHLREFQPLQIYSTAAVRRALTEENSLFRTLQRSNPPVQWRDLPFDRSVSLDCEMPSCRAVPLGGTFPDYVSERLRKNLAEEQAVIGIQLAQGEKKFSYAPSLPSYGGEWKSRVEESSAALLDGTFWTDDELVKIRGGGKTARQMGHLPLSGSGGLLEQLQHAHSVRRVLIHMNNTNPVLDEDSPASRTLRDSDWEVAYDGMEFEL